MAKHTVEVTDSTFDSLVLKSDKPVLVDFWAQWCGPCLAIAPAIEELAAEYKDQMIIAKVDVDANGQSTLAYNVMNIPTLLFFRNGQVVDKQVGSVPKSVLKQKIEAQVSA